MHYVSTTFIFFVLLKGLHNDLISITSCEQNYVYTMCKTIYHCIFADVCAFLLLYQQRFFVSNQILLQAIYRFNEVSLAYTQFFVHSLL